MDVPSRVHISPLGYERDRVVDPAIDYNADSIYLLEHEEPESEKPEYHLTLKDELRDAGITVRSVECDIFNLYTVLGTVAEIITTHTTDDVYVNLSTGSKISAIGGMIACMVTREAVNVTPYYVRAEGYSPDEEDAAETPVSFGMDSIYELPTYPIDRPSKAEITMLDHISEEEPITKKQLIHRAREVVDRFRRNAQDKRIEADENPRIGEYRLLDTHILDPLEARECIEVAEIGRSKEVTITEEGLDTLRAFEYLLDG